MVHRRDIEIFRGRKGPAKALRVGDCYLKVSSALHDHCRQAQPGRLFGWIVAKFRDEKWLDTRGEQISKLGIDVGGLLPSAKGCNDGVRFCAQRRRRSSVQLFAQDIAQISPCAFERNKGGGMCA